MNRGWGRFNRGDDWNDGPGFPPMMNEGFGGPRNFRNNRYDDAYGDYMGGYPPSGDSGFGPRRGSGFRSRGGGNFGPPGGGDFGRRGGDDFVPRGGGDFGPRGGSNFGPRGGGDFDPPGGPGFGPRGGPPGFGPRGGGGFSGPGGPDFGPGGNDDFGPPSLFGPPNFGPMGPPEPPGPGGPGQTFFIGRGFGPEGPPMRRNARDEKAVKYLIRCGVPKDNLKNLPRDLLDLIEPEYCGLCGLSFDSFEISRVHYVSKNHLKNQKKWLNQQSDTGYFDSGPRETPLKSRELYCELCDVHITSKSHSEAHYAGRPHRSIVEGRRPPKNPFLLQPGMERRVTQLVRREKRCLKTLEEAVEPAEKIQDVKPVQPELYCQICKTSVSCSEQMTMHMNGKKHLSKEKRHIFMMMKGGAAEQEEYYDEDYEEEEGEGEGEGDGEAEGDGQTAEQVDEDTNGGGENANDENAGNDDWANGSGNWDDPPNDA